MMRTLLLLFFCLGGALGMAQTTFIPDNNFEQALIDQNYDDVLDNEVLTANIENITFLNLTGVLTLVESFTAPGLGITDLTGIKDFVNLEVLWVQQNDLTVLDLEGMTSIRDVRAFFNELEQINIKGLTNLEIIGLNVNELKAIDVSTNTSLNTFDIAQNNLEFLDVSGLGNLTAMNVEDNPLLTCIQVESVVRANALNINAAFRKNGGTAFGASCATTFTRFPDRNFETYLIDNNIDTEGGIPNGLVRTADLANELSLNISNQAITDLTGLEAFSNLEILDVSNNNLNALRLQNVSLVEIYANNTNVPGDEIFFQNITSGSNLTNVTTLELQNNNLGNASSTFSFGGVPNVQTLNVSGNNFGTIILGGQTDNISNLIASNCPNLNTLTGLGSLSQLQELTIDNSNFTALDFSGLDLLSTLRVNNNDFESLNLKDIDDTLTTLNTTGNLRLSCIEVNSVANAEAQGGWQKDTTTEYLVDCNAPQPFTVAANLEGTGASPNFEITEGNSFTLNFNADATAVDGTQYTPNIQFALNGTPTTADFTFNGNTALPNQPFTVGSTEPDGSITILAIEDNSPEANETYTITITSPDNNLFSITDTSTFTITVVDAPSSTTEPLFITTSLKDLGGGPYYEVEEGDIVDLQIDANNNASEGAIYDLEISYETYTIGPSTGDSFGELFVPNFRTLQNTEEVRPTSISLADPQRFTVTENTLDGFLRFEIIDDVINEETEELVITVKAVQNNHTVSTEVFVIKIKASDPVTVAMTLEGAGTAPNYIIQEGATFNLVGNILGDTDETFNFILDDASETALKERDFTFSEPSFFSQGSGSDINIPFTVYLDSVTENQESITLKLPRPGGNFIWQNADQNTGELEFEVAITDVEFTATIALTDALLGTDGIYEITEGNSFNLSVTANNLPPEIEFKEVPLFSTLTINPEADNDIAISGTLDPFLFQNNQIATFDVVSDGIVENEEIVTITLPKPKANYTWTNANADGSFTFRIRIVDEAFTDPVQDYTINLFAISLTLDEFEGEVETRRPVVVENGVYRIKDNETLSIYLTPEVTTPVQKGMLINTIDGTAIFNTDYRSLNGLNENNIITNTGRFNDITFNFETMAPGTPAKTFALSFTPTTRTYNLSGPNNEVISYLENLVLPFEIESSGNRPAQEILLEVSGASENISDGDAITTTYQMLEGQIFTMELSARRPNDNQGAVYNMQFNINTMNSSLTPNVDYRLRIEDSQGNDMNGSLANYTVNNSAEYDAKITIELLEDGEKESLEDLIFSIVPDVEFDEFNGGITTLRTTLQGTVTGDQKQFRITVTEPGTDKRIVASLSNTGGTEGSKIPDTITCTLLDEGNNEYTDHTSTIEIPYTFESYNIDGLNLEENEFNPTPSRRVFVFEPGISKATIDVLYDNEDSVNDIDCDYYYLRLADSPSAVSNGIVVDKNPYLIKVADASEWLIFIDLDISNEKLIRPVIRNRHPADTYDQNNSGIANFLTQEIVRYEVEEGPETFLNFSIDAAKPVKQGKAYILETQTGGSSAKFNSDYSFLGGDNFLRTPINVLKDQIDKELIFKINEDNDSEEEFLNLTFKEPDTEKSYRYSKKDSRSYDNTYTIKILEAIPVSVQKNVADILENATEGSIGEFVLTVDRSNEKPNESKALDIRFSLKDGDATFFSDSPEETDYLLETENSIFFNPTDESGIIRILPNQTEAKIKIIPRNDDFDENDELVRLRIIDDFGYRPSATQGEDSIIIIDDDEADYTVTFENEVGSLFEDQDSTFEGILTIALDKVNETGQPIAIGLTVDTSMDNSAVFNEDYELFIINADETRNPITSITDLSVNIPAGSKDVRIAIVAKSDNNFDEKDEILKISISGSPVYGPGANTEQIIIIKNSAEDGTSNITILAEVISSSCDEVKKGRILVTNISTYTISAALYKFGESEAIEKKEIGPTTNANDTPDPFENLDEGRYLIYISNSGTSTLPENYSPPSFDLTVRSPNDAVLLNSIADKNFRIAKLTVSGSEHYNVWRNDELFSFETGTTMATTLEVPMVFGRNVFEIKGEKDCQDVIATTLFLNSVQSYPNPTTDMVYIAGFFSMETVNARVTELTGRTVINTQELNIDNGVLGVDLSNLSPGVYILHIETPNLTSIDLKIVKK
ncbi:T9SS type A sorting domain-containing protein [Maribacter chungangensis]|uniref:T9SS type A sorting domain-containing protein n=1 Tax=Maribacter chungangensis TaxID=1069117 RepID=A0ABW3AYZ6_9FLAO